MALFPAVVLTHQYNPALTLVFDNVERVEYDQRIRIAEHPIEDGQNITDHAQVEGYVITLVNARVSRTPVGFAPTGIVAPELAVNFFEAVTGIFKGPLLTTTPRGIFRNMLVQSYRLADEGRKDATFNVVLKNVRIARAVSVPVPARLPNPAAAAGSASEVPGGPQAPTPAAVDQSRLSSLTGVG